MVDGVTPRRRPVPSRESPKFSQDLVGDFVAAEGTRDYIAIEVPQSVEEPLRPVSNQENDARR